MITNFFVNNYKCLVDVRVPLTPIHVIIGENDSGKTSLLEAIHALCQSTEKELSGIFPGEWKGSELVYSGKGGRAITFEAQFGDAEHELGSHLAYHLEVDFVGEESQLCRVVKEWVEADQRVDLQIPGFNWSKIYGRDGLTRRDERDQLDSLAKRIGSASFYRFDPRTMAIPAAIDPNRKFRMDPDGFGLATLLDDILGHDFHRFGELGREFCDYFPQYRTVRIETTNALNRHYDVSGRYTTNNTYGKGILLETTQGHEIRTQQASDGAILFLGLLALIYSPKRPRFLLIEEPEKNVYPKRLNEIVDIIRRFHDAPPDQLTSQIIMTTHSPYLLTSFRPEEVTLLARRDGTGPVQARPLKDAPHIEGRLGNGEFYLGELWYNLSEKALFADA